MKMIVLFSSRQMFPLSLSLFLSFRFSSNSAKISILYKTFILKKKKNKLLVILFNMEVQVLYICVLS